MRFARGAFVVWLLASGVLASASLAIVAPPGAPPFDDTLAARIETAWAARPAGYKPRTRHLTADGAPRFINRLFLESSPYLLQHAHNPVDWHPWGDEAFALARRLGRPVLLSVGYSTCHWCHVMEEESFEDEEIARYLNEEYVAIKVDREERPDLDSVYLAALAALGSSGGWPMTLWLTPDRQPFFGGTYFPAHDGERGVKLGLRTLLAQLRQTYASEAAHTAKASTGLAEAIRRSLGPPKPAKAPPESGTLDAALSEYRALFDGTNGGLRGAPKFPADLPVRFLLRCYRRRADKKVLEMATLTLEKMAVGGIHDLVGGGFHRYSTDERWRVPHFEKMLYDNALLTLAYLDAYQATGRADFADVARGILGYVERDMRSPDGAFYSASDADSAAPDGRLEEGRFFTWTPPEIEAALGHESAAIAALAFGITAKGDVDGRSVLRHARDVSEVAHLSGRTEEAIRTLLNDAEAKLLTARSARPAPLRDDKIVTAWNGLMIGAYAQASLVLGEPAYAEAAARAAAFVLGHLRKDGRLLRSERNARTSGDAYLGDYAFMIAGLLNLYEATGEVRWLREAKALDTVLERLYEDEEQGGFFLSAADAAALLAREKPSADGAEPSGNSVQALNLLRLYELTSDDRYRQRAQRTLQAFAGRLDKTPAALPEMLLAFDFAQDRPKEIVIVAPHSRAEAAPFLAELRRLFVPNRVLTVATSGGDLAAQAELVPNLSGKTARDGRATAYVCERRTCRLPTTDPAAFAAQLMRAAP